MVQLSPRPDEDEMVKRAAEERVTRTSSHRPAGREGLEASYSPPRCRAPDLRPLLLLYALAECGEAEANIIETHVLECGACFQDLQCLDRTRALLREVAGSSSDVCDRLRQGLAGHRARD